MEAGADMNLVDEKGDAAIILIVPDLVAQAESKKSLNIIQNPLMFSQVFVMSQKPPRSLAR